jgi:anti-sigma regulatory factor (Ser/Thr protein kinase)
MGSCGTVAVIAGPESRSESPAWPPRGAESGEIELPRSLEAGRHARAFVERRFGPHLAARVVGDAKLVATELVNNAVIHGKGRITMRADVRSDAVRVEVIDEGSGNTPKVREEADGPGGRGLRMVDSLSLRWGTFEGTTHVWAELPLVPPATG